MSRYKIVADESTVQSFMNTVMPDLESRTQSYFLSLSARKKYFTAEQRKEYALAHSEMFGRKLVSSKGGMIKALREFELPYGMYTVRKDSDQALPTDPHVLTAYLNLYPVDTIAAWVSANQRISEALLNSAMHGSITEQFVPPMSTFMTECQKTRAFRCFVDTDFDVPMYSQDERIELSRMVRDQLTQDRKAHLGDSATPLQGCTVFTSSGFHILLRTVSIGFPFMVSIQTVKANLKRDMEEKGFSESDWEVVLNKNQMIPMPGTYQPVKGGDKHTVTFEKW